MRYLKVLVAAAMAMFAFAAVGTALASAEDPNSPSMLLLEGKVSDLTSTMKGGKSNLSTLAGKELTGTALEGKLKGCKPIGTNEKDTNLCEAVLDFTGVKQGAVACRSENAKAEKDPVETVLTIVDLHLASEQTASGELQPLLLFNVLGMSGGEAELTIVCGVVKNKVKGVIPCLLLPGLTNIPVTQEAEIKCALNASHDQETGKCEQLCEWLTEKPFQSNLGAGFEDAGMNATAKGTLSKDIFIDD
jgi:hypothetical protein